MPSPYDSISPEARELINEIFCCIGYIYNASENGSITPSQALNQITEFIKPQWQELFKSMGGFHAYYPF